MKLLNRHLLGAVVLASLPVVAFAQGNSQNAPGRAEVISSAHHDNDFVLRIVPGKAIET